MPPAMLLGMVRRVLIDQAAVARHVGQQDPTDAAGQAARQRDELLAPTVDRAEIAGDRVGHHVGHHAAVAAQAGEVQFVQQRAIERGTFVALQSAYDIDRRRGGVERLEGFCYRVQAMERAAVVVFIVTLDETGRDSVERPGTAEQGGKVVSHVKAPKRGSEFPRRLGAFAALLGSAETDIGQPAVIQGGEVPTRPSALTPNDDGGHEGRPNPKPAGPRRRGEEAKGVLCERMGAERHRFLSIDTLVSQAT